MSDKLFKAPSDTSQQMADCLAQGRAWGLKNDENSNARKLIKSLSVAHNRSQQQIELIETEFRIENSFDLLGEWEESVGIPDECIATSQTIEQRRAAVIERLKKLPIVTLADVQAYVDALFPSMGVIIYPGFEYYTFEYEFEIDFLSGVSDKFILVAEVPLSDNTFEYDFEIGFEGGVDTTNLECVLNKIIPANVYLIIEYVG